MGTKMGSLTGLLIVIILIGFIIIAFVETDESSQEAVRSQNTSESIQETLMGD